MEMKKPCYGAKLDVIKAFDKQWREAWYYRLKKNNFVDDYIIILKTYYDQLARKIKIENECSTLFKLSRCVKQGGIISGALFNFYIDDLIKQCAEAGLGAKFIDIIMSILGFCDDIGLLSDTITDLQKL